MGKNAAAQGEPAGEPQWVEIVGEDARQPEFGAAAVEPPAVAPPPPGPGGPDGGALFDPDRHRRGHPRAFARRSCSSWLMRGLRRMWHLRRGWLSRRLRLRSSPPFCPPAWSSAIAASPSTSSSGAMAATDHEPCLPLLATDVGSGGIYMADSRATSTALSDEAPPACLREIVVSGETPAPKSSGGPCKTCSPVFGLTGNPVVFGAATVSAWSLLFDGGVFGRWPQAGRGRALSAGLVRGQAGPALRRCCAPRHPHRVFGRCTWPGAACTLDQSKEAPLHRRRFWHVLANMFVSVELVVKHTCVCRNSLSGRAPQHLLARPVFLLPALLSLVGIILKPAFVRTAAPSGGVRRGAEVRTAAPAPSFRAVCLAGAARASTKKGPLHRRRFWLICSLASSLFRSLFVTMLGAACCVTNWQDVFKQYDDGDGVLSRDELKRMQADRCVVDELMPRRVGMLKAETSKLAEAVSSCGLIASGHLATALVACSLTLTSWTPTETVWFQKTSWRLPWSAP